MENFREDAAWHCDDRRSGRRMDRDADIQTQDKAQVISDSGTVVCSRAYVDNSKMYELGIIVAES